MPILHIDRVRWGLQDLLKDIEGALHMMNQQEDYVPVNIVRGIRDASVRVAEEAILHQATKR